MSIVGTWDEFKNAGNPVANREQEARRRAEIEARRRALAARLTEAQAPPPAPSPFDTPLHQGPISDGSTPLAADEQATGYGAMSRQGQNGPGVVGMQAPSFGDTFSAPLNRGSAGTPRRQSEGATNTGYGAMASGQQNGPGVAGMRPPGWEDALNFSDVRSEIPEGIRAPKPDNSWRISIPPALGSILGTILGTKQNARGSRTGRGSQGTFYAEKPKSGVPAAGQTRQVQEPQAPQGFNRTIDDYLNEADSSQFSAAGMADIAGREQYMRQRAAESDAQLQALYASIAGQLQAQDPQIAQRYGDANAATQANTEQAVGMANSNALNSQSAMEQMAKNLGTEAALPIAEQQGAGLANENQATLNNLATYGQLSGQALTDAGARERTLNTSNINASRFQGATDRSNLQSQLMQYLAALQDERATVARDSMDRALSLAQSRYNADYGQFQDERNYQTNRDDTAYDRAAQQMQFKLDRKGTGAAADIPTSASQDITSRLTARGVPVEYIDLALDAYNTVPVSPGRPASDYVNNVGDKLRDAGVPATLIPVLALEAEEYYQAYRG